MSVPRNCGGGRFAPRALHPLIAALCLAGAVATPATRIVAQQIVRPTPLEPHMPHATRPMAGAPSSVRIVDGLTGQPVPGAFLFVVEEAEVPPRGETTTRHHVRADRAGFARLDSDPQSWLLVEAAGYAPAMELGGAWDDRIVRLVPGVDVPIALRDYLDRPVVKGRVGFCMGCGHTPDVRVARTDEFGIGWLRGIDPGPTFEDGSTILDLYPLASGMDGDYDSFDWLPGDGPVHVRRAYRPDLAARFVDAAGQPLAGLIVRQYERHRGPVARTDEEGWFRMVSPMASRTVVVLRPDNPQPLLELDIPSMPMTIHVPPPRDLAGDPAEAPADETLLVRVEDFETGDPISDAVVYATAARPTSDSASDATRTGSGGRAELEVPRGQVVLTAGGITSWRGESRPSGFERTEIVIDVDGPSDADHPTRLRLRAQPVRRVEVRGLGESGGAALTSTEGEWQLDPTGTDVPVPVTAPAGVRLWSHGRELVWPLEPSDEALVLQWPTPTAVAGRMVDREGRGVRGTVTLANYHTQPVETDDDGTFLIRTCGEGGALLRLGPADPRYATAYHFVTVPEFARDWNGIDPGEGATLVVGPVTVRELDAAPLRVLDAQGAPLDGRDALLWRPGLARRAPLRAGAWEDLVPQAGDWVVVEPPDIVPPGNENPAVAEVGVRLRQQLQGPGPWVLREHPTQLRLSLVDVAGRAVEGGHVYVADHYFQMSGSTLTLRGLAPGRHTIAVYQTSHGAGTVDVEVGPGATAARVVLD